MGFVLEKTPPGFAKIITYTVPELAISTQIGFSTNGAKRGNKY
jgi:hypothetical protein